MAFLICIALIRAVNGAGVISVEQILTDISNLNINFYAIRSAIADIKNGELVPNTPTWNDALTGIDGFATNIKNVTVGAFNYTIEITKTVIVTLWQTVVELFTLVTELLNLAFSILGYT